jgi:exfoliative toxin A/B
MMLITLPLVTYRYINYPVILEQNKPLKCIYAALINILIVGYVNSFTSINTYFLFSLYIIASIFYLYSLYKFITYRKIPFYPSYSAFTFPFVGRKKAWYGEYINSIKDYQKHKKHGIIKLYKVLLRREKYV